MDLIKFVLIFVLVSCGSFKQVQLETIPTKARVSLYSNEQKKFIEVGESPFVLNEEMVKSHIRKENSFVALRVEKPGYVVEHVIYDLKTRKKINYLLQLKEIEIWSDTDAELSSKLANDIALKVQKLNRNILGKELDKALILAQVLIEQYPKAYIFYDIKGSIHLLKGNKEEAIVSLKKSLALNPDNLESESILKVLEKEAR